MQSSVLEVESRLSIEHSAREHFDIRIKMNPPINFHSLQPPFLSNKTLNTLLNI